MCNLIQINQSNLSFKLDRMRSIRHRRSAVRRQHFSGIHFAEPHAAVPRQERPGQGRICIEHFCGKI
jgi:hypothetical protein